jgi:hypothetical protein
MRHSVRLAFLVPLLLIPSQASLGQAPGIPPGQSTITTAWPITASAHSSLLQPGKRAASSQLKLAQACPPADPGTIWCAFFEGECHYCPNSFSRPANFWCPPGGPRNCFQYKFEAEDKCGMAYFICAQPVNPK